MARVEGEEEMTVRENPVTISCARPKSGQGGNSMYDLLKRHEVHILHDAGLSVRSIALQTKVSVGSVSRMLTEPRINELPELRGSVLQSNVGRPSVVSMYESLVHETLKDEPDLPTVEILHRLHQKGYTGSKSPLYELVARIRPVGSRPMVCFEGLPGEFSQHDFGQVRVNYLSGAIETIHFFASRLKYSRWSHVVLVPDESVESLVRALILAFENFGGVPLVAVFDNPKTIVVSHKNGRIEWNQTFGQVALDFRFAPELCTPGFANQKGSVENLVGWVKNGFFKVRRFHDRYDLATQLVEWLLEGNTKRPSRATNIIPAVRIEEERRRLRPLAFLPEEYPLRFPVFVGPTGWVQFNGIRYSMPPKAIHMAGTLFLYPERVKIVASSHVAEHPRVPNNGKVSTLAHHSTEALAAVSGRRAKVYYRRQRLLELGELAEKFLTELVHARPRVWMHDVEELFHAFEMFGADRLLCALECAYEKKLFGAEYVIELLQERVA